MPEKIKSYKVDLDRKRWHASDVRNVIVQTFYKRKNIRRQKVYLKILNKYYKLQNITVGIIITRPL